MLLYPILDPPQFAALSKRGRLTTSWRHIDPTHVPAYRWMVAAMLHRGIDTRGRPPVWGWHSYDPPHRPKPDLRSSYYLTSPGTRAVRLAIDAPDMLVLLSDFMAWQSVLNHSYLSLSEAADRRVVRARPTRRQVERSWSRIFDLTAGDARWLGKPGHRPIQACLPLIDAGWIRESTAFTARGIRHE